MRKRFLKVFIAGGKPTESRLQPGMAALQDAEYVGVAGAVGVRCGR